MGKLCSKRAQAKACTTKSSFLCEPRRIVGQAILPAAGFLGGFVLDVQTRPAGWRAGCRQDWLPHLAAKPHSATKLLCYGMAIAWTGPFETTVAPSLDSRCSWMNATRPRISGTLTVHPGEVQSSSVRESD